MKNRYIVEHDLSKFVKYSVSGCNTVEELYRYLDDDPHPEYHLVSIMRNSANYTLVWELTE